MNRAEEFEKWLHIWSNSDEDTGELAWRGLCSCIDNAECGRGEGDIQDAAREIKEAIEKAAFWLGLSAVICMAIWKFG